MRQAVISLIDAEPTLLSSLEKQQISDEVLDEVFGLGPLEPLLQDPTISDILVNTHKQVYVERRGLLELPTSTSATIAPAAHHRQNRSQVGRRIDESTPMVDARLKTVRASTPLFLRSPLMARCFPFAVFARKADAAGSGRSQGDDTGHDGAARGRVKATLNVIIAGGTGAVKPHCSTCSRLSFNRRSASLPSKTRPNSS